MLEKRWGKYNRLRLTVVYQEQGKYGALIIALMVLTNTM